MRRLLECERGRAVSDPVYLAITRASKCIHLQRDWSQTWCGANVHVRTGPPSPPTYLCPKCKTAHADAFGLANVQRKGKR